MVIRRSFLALMGMALCVAMCFSPARACAQIELAVDSSALCQWSTEWSELALPEGRGLWLPGVSEVWDCRFFRDSEGQLQRLEGDPISRTLLFSDLCVSQPDGSKIHVMELERRKLERMAERTLDHCLPVGGLWRFGKQLQEGLISGLRYSGGDGSSRNPGGAGSSRNSRRAGSSSNSGRAGATRGSNREFALIQQSLASGSFSPDSWTPSRKLRLSTATSSFPKEYVKAFAALEEAWRLYFTAPPGEPEYRELIPDVEMPAWLKELVGPARSRLPKEALHDLGFGGYSGWGGEIAVGRLELGASHCLIVSDQKTWKLKGCSESIGKRAELEAGLRLFPLLATGEGAGWGLNGSTPLHRALTAADPLLAAGDSKTGKAFWLAELRNIPVILPALGAEAWTGQAPPALTFDLPLAPIVNPLSVGVLMALAASAALGRRYWRRRRALCGAAGEALDAGDVVGADLKPAPTNAPADGINPDSVGADLKPAPTNAPADGINPDSVGADLNAPPEAPPDGIIPDKVPADLNAPPEAPPDGIIPDKVHADLNAPPEALAGGINPDNVRADLKPAPTDAPTSNSRPTVTLIDDEPIEEIPFNVLPSAGRPDHAAGQTRPSQSSLPDSEVFSFSRTRPPRPVTGNGSASRAARGTLRRAASSGLNSGGMVEQAVLPVLRSVSSQPAIRHERQTVFPEPGHFQAVCELSSQDGWYREAAVVFTSSGGAAQAEALRELCLFETTTWSAILEPLREDGLREQFAHKPGVGQGLSADGFAGASRVDQALSADSFTGESQLYLPPADRAFALVRPLDDPASGYVRPCIPWPSLLEYGIPEDMAPLREALETLLGRLEAAMRNGSGDAHRAGSFEVDGDATSSAVYRSERIRADSDAISSGASCSGCSGVDGTENSGGISLLELWQGHLVPVDQLLNELSSTNQDWAINRLRGSQLLVHEASSAPDGSSPKLTVLPTQWRLFHQGWRRRFRWHG